MGAILKLVALGILFKLVIVGFALFVAFFGMPSCSIKNNTYAYKAYEKVEKRLAETSAKNRAAREEVDARIAYILERKERELKEAEQLKIFYYVDRDRISIEEDDNGAHIFIDKTHSIYVNFTQIEDFRMDRAYVAYNTNLDGKNFFYLLYRTDKHTIRTWKE